MPSASNGFDYRSKAWKKLRSQAITRDHSRCNFCGNYTPKPYVDHKKPVREYPELAFTLSNLQVLCPSHHNGLKQAIENRARSEKPTNPVGIDGLPVDGSWTT